MWGIGGHGAVSEGQISSAKQMMLVDVASKLLCCCNCLLSAADSGRGSGRPFLVRCCASAAVSAALVSANILLGGSKSHGRVL